MIMDGHFTPPPPKPKPLNNHNIYRYSLDIDLVSQTLLQKRFLSFLY